MYKHLLWLFAAALLSPGAATAQKVEVKGVGSYHYEGGFFSSKPTDEEKEKAVASAKLSAWKNLVSQFNQAKQKAIFKHEKELLANLEKFIISSVIVDTYGDKDTKTLNVVIRTAFNEETINQFIEGLTIGGDGVAEARSKDSVFTFLFMARKATSITQFDARRTDVQQNDSSISVTDGSTGEVGTSSSSKIVIGGSASRKEDAVTYAVSSSQDLDSAMGEVITTSGIEYVGYDDVVASCDGVPPQAFRDEYVSADELSPKTRANVIKAARECGVRYFAYGTIDAGVADIDPVSGNKRVFVSVRSQLWDISMKLPRKIGSVGPKQYLGLGPDQSVASRNALSVASRDLAKTLVDQLNIKGIR